MCGGWVPYANGHHECFWFPIRVYLFSESLRVSSISKTSCCGANIGFNWKIITQLHCQEHRSKFRPSEYLSQQTVWPWTPSIYESNLHTNGVPRLLSSCMWIVEENSEKILSDSEILRWCNLPPPLHLSSFLQLIIIIIIRLCFSVSYILYQSNISKLFTLGPFMAKAFLNLSYSILSRATLWKFICFSNSCSSSLPCWYFYDDNEWW